MMQKDTDTPYDRIRLRLRILTILASVPDVEVNAPAFIDVLKDVEAWVTGPDPVTPPVPPS